MDTLFHDEGQESMMSTMKRMLMLQEERAKRVNEINARHHAALAELRRRHMAQFKAAQKEEEKLRVQLMESILTNVERRKALEAGMRDVVCRMDAQLGQVEDMMLAGYRGREAEARQCAGGGLATSATGEK